MSAAKAVHFPPTQHTAHLPCPRVRHSNPPSAFWRTVPRFRGHRNSPLSKPMMEKLVWLGPLWWSDVFMTLISFEFMRLASLMRKDSRPSISGFDSALQSMNAMTNTGCLRGLQAKSCRIWSCLRTESSCLRRWVNVCEAVLPTYHGNNRWPEYFVQYTYNPLPNVGRTIRSWSTFLAPDAVFRIGCSCISTGR